MMNFKQYESEFDRNILAERNKIESKFLMGSLDSVRIRISP